MINLILILSFITYREDISVSKVKISKMPYTHALQKYKKIVDRVKKLYELQNEMYWDNWVYGKQVNIADTYKGYEDIFSPKTIRFLRLFEMRTSDPTLRKSVEYLAEDIIVEYLNRHVAKLQDAISNYSAQAKVKVGNKEIPYRQLYVLIAREDDYNKRFELFKAGVPVLKKLSQLIANRDKAIYNLLKKVGYKDYLSLAEDLKDVNLKEMEEIAKIILKNTKGLYLKLLDEVAELNGLSVDKLRGVDISYILSPKVFDKYFPKYKLIPTLKDFLLGIGIDLDKQKNILIDSEERPKKYPRAVCFPIRPPEYIKVSIKPMGGFDDYHALFHEMGHAEHYAHTFIPHWPLKMFGSFAVTETYAFLFDSMMERYDWVKTVFKMPKNVLKKFMHFMALHKLYFLRRYAAKTLYEIRYHSNKYTPEQLRALYKKLLSEAYQIKLSDEYSYRYRTDIDEYFYVVDYLRAWIMEGMLSARLAKRYGKNWWNNPRAGDYLKDLWYYGNALTPDEFVRKIGYKRLTIAPLVKRIKFNALL